MDDAYFQQVLANIGNDNRLTYDMYVIQFFKMDAQINEAYDLEERTIKLYNCGRYYKYNDEFFHRKLPGLYTSFDKKSGFLILNKISE